MNTLYTHIRMSDFIYRASEKLSEVMEDIGVNEMLVMKRRRTWRLIETIRTMYPSYDGSNGKVYMFGSQTEGSTTLGLKSDVDTLFYTEDCNVIQDMREWKPGAINFKMIQNNDISPGYCYLQPASANDMLDGMLEDVVTGSDGGLLWKNTFFNFTELPLSKHGPAHTTPGTHGTCPIDIVPAVYCKSSPHQVTSWLQKQREAKWPTPDVLKDCRNAGCFLVQVGSKVHSSDILESTLEWRISTSLQERYIMFSLNIPQLMCYVLLKMILKTHINPYVTDVLSSFMCKNVLLYCIANSSGDWHTGNLLAYLHLCLFMLKECIEQRNCPHFINPENNLLAGHMTDAQRDLLLRIVNTRIRNDKQSLFKIEIDDLGERLKRKLNMIPYCPDLISAAQNLLGTSIILVHSIARAQNVYLNVVLNIIQHGIIERVDQFLAETCSSLEIYRNEGDLQRTASNLLIPLVCSRLGSVMACIDIDTHAAISDHAFHFLEAGKESDALSGRLQLVSVLYCTGDIERVERELTIIQTQCNIAEVNTLCHCYIEAFEGWKYEGRNNFEHYNEKAIQSNVAYCTRFLQCEINCAPRELRYEILKSYIQKGKQTRIEQICKWMDFITVDSIPYFYFLQYKVYGQLQRRQEQLNALFNFDKSFVIEHNLGHKDTSFNLLGQICEQENMQTAAIQCYIASLKHRKRNNAARFLLCIQLYKLWKQDNTQ